MGAFHCAHNEKTFRDRGSGFKDYCPIDYGRTITGLLHREIKSYFDLVKFLNLA